MNDKILNHIRDSVDDPSSNYNGTSLEGADAFDRQLRRFGIRIPTSSECSLESLVVSNKHVGGKNNV